MDAAEEGRESPEFVLFPFIKRMIVTLSALQMDAEKCQGNRALNLGKACEEQLEGPFVPAAELAFAADAPF